MADSWLYGKYGFLPERDRPKPHANTVRPEGPLPREPMPGVDFDPAELYQSGSATPPPRKRFTYDPLDGTVKPATAGMNGIGVMPPNVSVGDFAKGLHGFVKGIGETFFGGGGDDKPETYPAKPEKPDVAPPVEATPPAVVASPIPPSPDETMEEGVGGYFDFLKKYFGEAPNGMSPQQSEADAAAKQQLDRTRLLAQLAFAGGLTAAGGGSWEKIGQGFTNAAAVHDKGFARYQEALQDSADRQLRRDTVKYQTDVGMRDAALKLYSADRSEARERAQKRADKLIDSQRSLYEKEWEAILKGDEMGTMEPERAKDWAARRRLYDEDNSLGYIPPGSVVDVRG